MSHDVGVHGKSTKQHPGSPLRRDEARQDLLRPEKVQLKHPNSENWAYFAKLTMYAGRGGSVGGGGPLQPTGVYTATVHGAESQGVVRPVWMALELGLRQSELPL